MKKYSFLFPILALGCETKKSENNNDFGNYNDILAKLKEFSQNNALQASFYSLVAKNSDKPFKNSVSEFTKQDDISPENKGKTLYRLLYALFDKAKNPENIKNTLSEVDPTVITYIKQWTLSNGDNDLEKNNKLLEILKSIVSNKQNIDFHPSPYLGEDAPAVGAPDSTIKNVDEWLRDISLKQKSLDADQWELGLGLVKNQADFDRIITSDKNFTILNKIALNDLIDIIENKIKNRGINIGFSDKTLPNLFNFFHYDVLLNEYNLIRIVKLCDKKTDLKFVLNEFFKQPCEFTTLLGGNSISISNDDDTFLGWVANNRTSDFDSIVQEIPDDRINPADSAIDVLNSIVGKNIVLSPKSLNKILLFMGVNKIQKTNLDTLIKFICENISEEVEDSCIFEKYYSEYDFSLDCLEALIKSKWNFDKVLSKISIKGNWDGVNFFNKFNFDQLLNYISLPSFDKIHKAVNYTSININAIRWENFFNNKFNYSSLNFLIDFFQNDYDRINAVLNYINGKKNSDGWSFEIIEKNKVLNLIIEKNIILDSGSFGVFESIINPITGHIKNDDCYLDILYQVYLSNCKNDNAKKKLFLVFYGNIDEKLFNFLLEKDLANFIDIIKLTSSSGVLKLKSQGFESIVNLMNKTTHWENDLEKLNKDIDSKITGEVAIKIWEAFRVCEDVKEKQEEYINKLLEFISTYPCVGKKGESDDEKWKQYFEKMLKKGKGKVHVVADKKRKNFKFSTGIGYMKSILSNKNAFGKARSRTKGFLLNVNEG